MGPSRLAAVFYVFFFVRSNNLLPIKTVCEAAFPAAIDHRRHRRRLREVLCSLDVALDVDESNAETIKFVRYLDPRDRSAFMRVK